MNEKIRKKCENVLEKAKKEPYKYCFNLALFILVVIPAIIWFAFFIGDCGYVLIHTSLGVGDLLSYYGTTLSFIGTVSLGAVTIIQNNRLTKMNLLLLEENKRAQLPSLYASNAENIEKQFGVLTGNFVIGEKCGADICYVLKNDNGNIQLCYTLFKLKNISGFPITGVRPYRCTINTLGGGGTSEFTPMFYDQISLGNDEEKIICIKLVVSTVTSVMIDLRKLQINVKFECYNPQKRRVEFNVTSIIHHNRCDVCGQDIITEYKEKS